MSEQNRKCPPHVACLGYGGLLPFVGLATLAAVDPAHARAWSDALVGYGAVILSFVGALHWGVAMIATKLTPGQRRWAFVWSVVPALIAWPASVLAGSGGALMLVLGFACHLIQDLRLAGPAELPSWYLPLRWRLTVVGSSCLVLNAWMMSAQG